MKRALAVVLLLAAALAGVYVAVTSPAGRTSNARGDWAGHTVSFYLPKDAGLQLVTATGPQPVNIALSDKGELRFNGMALKPLAEGGGEELAKKIRSAQDLGTTEFTIHGEENASAADVIRVHAICLANGVTQPELGAVLSIDGSPFVAGTGPAPGFSPPIAPRAIATRAREIPKKDVVIVFVDGLQKRMVLRSGDAPDERVNQQTLYKRLKLVAADHQDPAAPHLSDALVLIHCGPDVTWHQFVIPLYECAKVGIWRIEAVVTDAR